jgi:hypothetical protein
MLHCNEAFTYTRLEAPMSKQLTFSATLSVLAMAALALGTMLPSSPGGGSAGGAATAHGSVIKVLLRS